jgi:alpha-L-fucosidase 2
MSPENSYRTPEGHVGRLAMGPTMDNQIITELFNHTIDAAQTLGIDPELREKLAAARDRLPHMQIGKHGQLQEWPEDYEEVEPGHRHVSHLFALHPGSQIDPWRTPQWLKAARNVLERRQAHGGGHTGWSRAWMISFYARLLDGEEAAENVRQLLRGCILPNLLDVHPPYQIDGNFGLTAGVVEMLLQSHARAIVLLPALPNGWTSGSVRGLRARGGITVDMTWTDGKLTEASLTADRNDTFTLRYPANASPVAIEGAQGEPETDEHGPRVDLTLPEATTVRLRFA